VYNYYVKNSIATFVEVPVSVKEMEAKILKISTQYPWFVFEENGKVLGYAYANKWNERAAYRHSLESSIYLRNGALNKGIGSALYQSLLDEISKSDYHVVIGGISLPNEASVRLHEKLGYRKAAHYKEVGYKFEQWVDVGYWQLILK
jgi:phosphinothricin acetyltransferase